jgi:hypothetical protein
MCRLDEHGRTFEELEIETMHNLVAAGFGDLDSRLRVRFFCVLASVLRMRSLDSFKELNEQIGTRRLHIGSGRVLKSAEELAERGYLQLSRRGGVKLTDRGGRAAQAVLTFDPYVRKLGLDEDIEGRSTQT